MSSQIFDGNVHYPGTVTIDTEGSLTVSGTTTLNGAVSVGNAGSLTVTPWLGGAVTQLTSPTTAVTLNAKAGIITMEAAAAATGSAFTFNNNFITAASQVLAWSQNTVCATSSFPLLVIVSAIAAGHCTITVAGDGTHASVAASEVQFIVF
jgi:hypothetical protein